MKDYEVSEDYRLDLKAKRILETASEGETEISEFIPSEKRPEYISVLQETKKAFTQARLWLQEYRRLLNVD